MALKLIRCASLLIGAEGLASWSIWGLAPTDTLRVWYPSFWAFELGRLRYWIPMLVLAALLWGLGWSGLHRRIGRVLSWVLSGAVAVATEIGTSIWYWKSSASVYVRGLYESAWYWNRVPEASDLGWPSFRGYMLAHLVRWAVVLLLGWIAWRLWNKRRERGAVAHSGRPLEGRS
jgi:hypothetical protein